MVLATEHSTSQASRPSVLVVEDEFISRWALAKLLSSSGYPTTAVESGEEALRLCKRGKLPSVALVDLDLPGMNGLELIEHLRRTKPNVIPFLVTATSMERLEAELADGSVRYLRKPLDFRQLLMALSESQPEQ